jgi:nitrous oxidase accessory protein
MSKTVALLLVLVFLTASWLVSPLSVEADFNTIVVPDDYSTITDAVGNATDGDTIFIKKGTYEIKENVIVINKTLSIIGEDQVDTGIVFPPDTRTGYELFSSKIGFRVIADNFKISNLTITNCDFGIQATGNGTQVSNILTSSIYLNGNYCKIYENSQIITSSYQRPLTVKGSFNYIGHKNNFDIQCEGTFNNIIENSGDVTIEVKGNSNFIARNSVRDINLDGSNSTTIYNNSVGTISLIGCYNNTVCGNIVNGPIPSWGVFMGTGSDNVFYGNNITDFNAVLWRNERPYGYGVAIGGDAENNLFYHNNFVNNYKHVSANWEISSVGNYWDNGETGNYWDDYSGLDSNSDGIGDAHYTIKGLTWDDDAYGHVETVFGQDHYPLMVPFDISSVFIELPEWAPPTPVPSPFPSPEPESFPTALIATASGVSVAIIGVGLLVYFKKRKHVIDPRV